VSDVMWMRTDADDNITSGGSVRGPRDVRLRSRQMADRLKMMASLPDQAVLDEAGS